MVQPTGVGRPVCVLVKRVWSELKPKTGSRGKYKAESRRQAGATVCGTPVHSATQKKFLQRVICKPAPSKNCPGCYEVEIALSYELTRCLRS